MNSPSPKAPESNWQRFPASRIVAIDMGRGVAVIQTADKQLKALTFSKQQGLQVAGEVVLQ